MTFYDFLFAIGLVGVAAIVSIVAVVFIVAFLLAQPGKEFSFFGIKFYKREFSLSRLSSYRFPRLWYPQEWSVIWEAFASYDDDNLFESLIVDFTETKGITRLETQRILSDMAAADMVSYMSPYVSLSDRGRKRASKVKAAKRLSKHRPSPRI